MVRVEDDFISFYVLESIGTDEKKSVRRGETGGNEKSRKKT